MRDNDDAINVTNRIEVGDSGTARAVLVDDVNAVYGFSDNITHTCLYIEYTQGTHDVQIYGTWVVPEFPMFMIQILFIVAAIVAVISRKKVKKA
jgi:hypothetical protein